MLRDNLLLIQASTTKTADFSSAAFHLANHSGNMRHKPLFVEVNYSAASDAQAPVNSSAQFNVEHSDDGVAFTLLTSGADQVVTLDTTAKSGAVWLPVVTDKPYIRVSLDITAGDGNSTPTITYRANLGTSKP